MCPFTLWLRPQSKKKGQGALPPGPPLGISPQTPFYGGYNNWGSGASGPSGVQGQSPWP